MRVYELAKELQVDKKVLLDIVKRKKLMKTKANQFTDLGEAEEKALRGAVTGKGAALRPKAGAAKPKQPAAADENAPKEHGEKKQPENRPNEASLHGRDKDAASAKNTAAQSEKRGDGRSEKHAEKRESNRSENRGETHAENRQESGQGERRRSRGRGRNQDAKNGERAEGRGGNNNKNGSNNRNNGGARQNDQGGRAKTDERGERGDRHNREKNGDGNNGNTNRNRAKGTKNAGRSNKDSRANKENRDNRSDNRNVNHQKERRGKNKRNQPQAPVKVEIARPKHIKLGESIAVKDLASKMSCTAAEVIKKLLLMGVMASINQEIDFDTATLVAGEFGVTTEALPPEVDPTEIPEVEHDSKALKLRPPVVTVMGHVDHGKTSLLDVIRKTSVTASEAGGITQHIGAYQVMCKDKKIVFLDTPGHEAFTAMRARGAQVTDIAILVVAADDGVMPQTVEAIAHAKSANVPIIVAINKIDKPGANPDRVKQELMEHGLVPEEYGGETIMVPVSAKKKLGINDLLEMVLLVAEVQELKADPTSPARGVIIEAELDKGRGSVATVLVQDGTLRIGDSILAGTTYGKVRAMINDRGDNVKKAGPSVPVEVLGLNDVPAAGDILAVLDEKQVRSIAEARLERQRTKLIKAKKVSLDDLFQQIQEGSIKDLNIVVKADVQGTVEALNSSLVALNKNDEVRVSIVHSGVGAVSESDVMLASASNALIIAFNVRPDANARRLADAEDIDIRTYRVIYDAINDVKAAMSGMLAPKYKEVVQGHVEIRKVMKFSKALVAGSYVLDGKIFNNSKIRIIRDNIEIFDGAIDSLRRFKDEVKEVAAGYECGISIVDFKDFREGDIIEPYMMEEIETSITEANKEAAKRREEQESHTAATEDGAEKTEGEG